MSNKTFDAIIVGAGAVGSALAFELSKNGLKVGLLESNIVAAGASGVSAAMLEAQMDAFRGEPFLSLALASRDLFPALWSELNSLTGIDFQYELCGILQLASDEAERLELRKRFEDQISKGLAVQWLEPDAVAESLPQIEGGVVGGLFHAGDGQVNASRFTCALAEGARRGGCAIIEGSPVKGFAVENGKIAGVHTDKESFLAPIVVIAAGAWSHLLGVTVETDIPVEPVRGQLVVYETPRPLLPYPVFWKSRYLTPKADGFLLAGTTVERVGFDSNTTAEGLDAIAKDAVAFLPLLKSRPNRGGTAGLRPGSPDLLPILDAIPGVQGLFVCTGHYRNGILLAPITAKIMSAMVLGLKSPVSPEPFRLGRFASAPTP